MCINLIFYADDTSQDFELDSSSAPSESDLFMNAINTEFEFLRLKLNTGRTEFMIVRMKNPRMRSDLTLPLSSTSSSTVELLGVKVDCHLNMEPQINAVIASCYYQLRKLHSLRDSVDKNTVMELA